MVEWILWDVLCSINWLLVLSCFFYVKDKVGEISVFDLISICAELIIAARS